MAECGLQHVAINTRNILAENLETFLHKKINYTWTYIKGPEILDKTLIHLMSPSFSVVIVGVWTGVVIWAVSIWVVAMVVGSSLPKMFLWWKVEGANSFDYNRVERIY